MIHVQIASRLTLSGVDGIRWVLVDDSDAPPPDAAPVPVAVAAADHPAPAEVAARGRTSLALMKSLVMGAGFGAAVWMAQTNFGPPTVRWWQDPPAMPKAGVLMPAPSRSAPLPAGNATQPLPPEPAGSAASAAPHTLTAANP